MRLERRNLTGFFHNVLSGIHLIGEETDQPAIRMKYFRIASDRF